MYKFDFLKNGIIKLPPGFRFQPTDEELVFQYLKCKVFSLPLPASIIPQIINLCKFDPWSLPGDVEKERYFFSNKEARYRNGIRMNWATGSGYWKPSGADKQIVSQKNNQIVGMKKTLVFYIGKPCDGVKTDWVMHEYRLVLNTSCNLLSLKTSALQNLVNQLESWVLYRVFMKKPSAKIVDEGRNIDRYLDFLSSSSSSSPSSYSSSSSTTSSSSITWVSSTDSDHEEEESRI